MLTDEKVGVTKATWHVNPNVSFIQEYQSSNNYISKIAEDPRIEALEKEIDDFYRENKETKAEFSRKEAFREALEALITEQNKGVRLNWSCRIFPTGSTISGLATRNSDVDLCLFIPGAFEEKDNKNRKACLRILQIVRHCIYYGIQEKRFPYTIKSVDIIDAQIQLLKIFLENGLEVDLSVCTDRFLSGCHNSYLIRGYCGVDPRFAPLCILIKQWAARTKFKDPHPKQGRFNSYAVVMLIIHFLQSGVHPPVLPNLQRLFPDCYAQTPKVFPNVIDFGPTPPIPFTGENKMTKAELFLRFLIYYKEFDFWLHCVSLRESGVTFRDADEADPRNNRVSIRDPIDQHNPGRTVKDLVGVTNILRATLELFENSQREGHGFPTIDDFMKVQVRNLWGV